jgi:hypothetical protein
MSGSGNNATSSLVEWKGEKIIKERERGMISMM